MDRLERVARALCIGEGENPDGEAQSHALSEFAAMQAAEARGEVFKPRWREFEKKAQAFIAAFDAASRE
jgi:hypothetical protein